ncbi:uncharacterized protein SAPINGB_P006074 [Magnusiomyces paraingens]|uniref:chitin synthase n=1 Tax=Magnusiomyces paraingens TaxID=2606893 RepID=A0A5E8C333_9ASCO|nr:uncharacterized protein SAPINGB_P006074 [Saprochaete ingens]VVT58174.1 unnamed protein product [Saprochaete ingens]
MDAPPLCNAAQAISTSSLIATLHQTFVHSQYRSLRLDSTSFLVFGPNIEEAFVVGVWDHGRRRSEDQTIVVLPTHNAASTSFFSTVSAFPGVNPAVLQSLNVITPFLTALTPENLSRRFHNGLGVAFSLSSTGQILSTRLNIAEDPLSSYEQLLNLPSAPNNRVFDVFYHVLLAEAESYQSYLSLKSSPNEYKLLAKSNTYSLPEWVLFSDDYALAKDWSNALRQCGIKGSVLRGVLSTLSGILLLGNSSSPDDVAEGCSLIGIEPATFEKYSTQELITSAYSALIHNVVAELNKFLAGFDHYVDRSAQPQGPHDDTEDDPNEVVSIVTIVEGVQSYKKTILHNVFDDSFGINKELKEDGIKVSKTPASVLKTIKKLYENDPMSTKITRQIPNFRAFLNPSISYIATSPATAASSQHRSELIEDDDSLHLNVESLITCSRVWTVLNLSPSTDAVSLSNDLWSSQIVSQQLREYMAVEWSAKRRNIDFSADFDFYEFLEKYSAILPPNVGVFNLEEWARYEKQWGPAEFSCGSARIWLSEPVWRDLEIGLENVRGSGAMIPIQGASEGYDQFGNPVMAPPPIAAGINPFETGSALSLTSRSVMPQYQYSQHTPSLHPQASAHNPYQQQQQFQQSQSQSSQQNINAPYGNQYGASNSKENHALLDNDVESFERDSGDEEMDDYENEQYYLSEFKDDIEKEAAGKPIEIIPMSSERKAWVWFVWMVTFWIPSPFLKWFGRMKRSDVRMAWREKVVICGFIFLVNAGIIFYMIFLSKIICPEFNKVWNINEVSEHNSDDNFYVAVHGKVYDISKFWRIQHSDTTTTTTTDVMKPFAGMDLTDYFPPPLTVACEGLVTDTSVMLSLNTTLDYPDAEHKSGSYYVTSNTTALYNYTWYDDVFLPKMKNYYKGELVVKKSVLKKEGQDTSNPHYWAIIDNKIYDLVNYMYTIDLYPSSYSSVYEKYEFLYSDLVDLFQSNAGEDITELVNDLGWDRATRVNNMNCLQNMFYAGVPDFRYTARCQASNIILLVLAASLSMVTVVKFVASLQFGSKALPPLQDKFVICQVPAYTEDEDALRRAIDSLTALKYDNRRKLITVICDGNIIGSGNDKPTPRIVLDIFGVDPKVDPPALPFQSVGEGAAQLNYAKIYSGLYDFEGDVVPFLVIVKVGKPSETSKPGNRGKRDSQILLMSFLNRVHYQRPMNPMELEIFHHINNVIGVDPELYEYLFMVDADTSVADDSLNRLVAACANDSRIAGICGETGLQNEEKSLSTMIQVYEYYISHHLTKAFESLFGSVTCLPGCFSMYRLRTLKKAKPLFISDEIIRDYSVGQVDTLHKKNLFSLGEDRYLTTLMAKYYPRMKYTFIPDAHAYTQAPDEFSVLLSQRRRWINSTVHNLVELLRLRNMCGFLCFSMRLVVMIDLAGTIMLPSVCVYLGYLIYVMAGHVGAFPLISIIMIAAVYGLQALVFILRRQWQHVFWMLIYVAAYPIHSFILPIYSFWYMDNFSWGNTRIVVGEKNGKQIVAVDDEGFEPSMIPLETWESYATRTGIEGAIRNIVFDEYYGRISNIAGVNTEMQDWNTIKPRGHINAMMNGYDASGAQSIYSRPDYAPSQHTFSQFSMAGPQGSGAQSAAASRYMSLMGPAPTIGGSTVGLPTATTPLDPEREAKISVTIRQVLQSADLDNMTKRQLRARVEDLMGVTFVGDKIAYVDRLIDEELEKLDDEDSDDEGAK